MYKLTIQIKAHNLAMVLSSMHKINGDISCNIMHGHSAKDDHCYYFNLEDKEKERK